MTRTIFISYTRVDRDVVAEMHDDLTAMGNEVFYDEELTGGQVWWSTLLDHIRRSDIFIPVVSREWFDSIPCQRELAYARDLDRKFLPVVLGDVPTGLLPPIIAETHWVSYRGGEKDSVLEFARAVNLTPGGRPLPDPLPPAPEVPISYLIDLRDKVSVERDISRHEQNLIVSDIRRHVSTGRDTDELVMVLSSFRRRADLNVHVANEIDDLLGSLTAVETVALPLQPPSPDPVPRVVREPEPQLRPPTEAPSTPTPAMGFVGEPQRGGDRAATPGRAKIVTSYVLSAVAVVFVPIVFGPIAMWLGHSAGKSGHPSGRRALIIAIGATIAGIVFAAIAFS